MKWVTAGKEPQSALEVGDELTSRRIEPADFFCGVTVAAALVAGLAGARTEMVLLGLTAIAMLGLRQLALPRAFELSVAFGIVLQGWGNAVWLFERVSWYDKAVHFLTPLLMVPALYLLLARVGALPPLRDNGLQRGTLGVLVVTFALGAGLAGCWELIEGTSDLLLGTSLAHGYYETIGDLYSSVLGSVAAGALLAWVAMFRDADDLTGDLSAVKPPVAQE